MDQQEIDEEFELDVFDQLQKIQTPQTLLFLTETERDLTRRFESEARMSQRQQVVIELLASRIEQNQQIPSPRLLRILNNPCYSIRIRSDLQQRSEQRKRIRALTT